MTACEQATIRVPDHGFHNDRRLVSFTRADLVEVKPIDWLIDNWLVKNSLASLIGSSGVGKSFLAIDWACHVAMGMSWNGHKAQRGGVLYLAGEGQQGLRKRIGAWEAHFGRTMAYAPLYLSTGLPSLCDGSGAPAAVDAIQDQVDDMMFNAGAVEPALIIVDTLARAMVGENENASESMGRLIDGLDLIRSRWQATILVIHHTGHGSPDRARGSSALYAALDSEFLLKDKKNAVELSATKGKDWSVPSTMMFEKVLVEVKGSVGTAQGLPVSSLVLRSLKGTQLGSERRMEVERLSELGHSQREIAKQTGVPRSTVQHWLNGIQQGPFE